MLLQRMHIPSSRVWVLRLGAWMMAPAKAGQVSLDWNGTAGLSIQRCCKRNGAAQRNEKPWMLSHNLANLYVVMCLVCLVVCLYLALEANRSTIGVKFTT